MTNLEMLSLAQAEDQIMEVQGEKQHKQMLKLLKQEPDTWLTLLVPQDVYSCGVNCWRGKMLG